VGIAYVVDGAVFHWAVAVMLHTLERIYTYLRRGRVCHGGLPDSLEHSDHPAIQRSLGGVVQLLGRVEAQW